MLRASAKLFKLLDMDNQKHLDLSHPLGESDELPVTALPERVPLDTFGGRVHDFGSLLTLLGLLLSIYYGSDCCKLHHS